MPNLLLLRSMFWPKTVPGRGRYIWCRYDMKMYVRMYVCMSACLWYRHIYYIYYINIYCICIYYINIYIYTAWKDTHIYRERVCVCVVSSPGPKKYVVLNGVWIFYVFSSLIIWKIKVLERCVVFGMLILSSILGCLLFVVLLVFDRWSWYMNGRIICPITSWNIEIHCVSWYFM